MLKGETIRVLVDYDLFENNVKGHSGVFIKKDTKTKKCLIYFPAFSEWGELLETQFERVDPDYVTKENRQFISLVKTLEYTL